VSGQRLRILNVVEHSWSCRVQLPERARISSFCNRDFDSKPIAREAKTFAPFPMRLVAPYFGDFVGGEMLTANIVSSSARAVSSALTRTNAPTCSPLHLADHTTAIAATAGWDESTSSIVALSFAGIGQDRTTVEIWADSALNRNTHQIQVDADSARFSMFIENIPSQNPRTVESPRFRSSHTYVS
jgi:hypothetical protein